MSLTHEEQACNITNDTKGEYDARDVESRQYRNLEAALNAVVAQFTVELLEANEVKPHVVFKFNLNAPIVNNRYRSVRFSMEVGDTEDGDMGPGACQIKLCGYTGRTQSARAGFQFQVKQGTTVRQLVEIVTGRAPNLPDNMKADMRRFTFCDVNGAFDGCRDWIAQAFVRFHHMKLVNWEIMGILGPDGQLIRDEPEERFAPEGPPARVTRINWHTAGFHDIIGKYFQSPVTARPGTRPVIRYRDLPLENGKWWARGFARVCRVAISRTSTVEITYRDPKPNTGDASSRPPSRSGGGGTVAGPSGTQAGRGAPGSGGRGVPPPNTGGRGIPPPTTGGRGIPPPTTSGRGVPPPTGRGGSTRRP